MNRMMRAGLALAALTGGAADAVERSVCTRLVDEARLAPPAIWATPEPLAPWLKFSPADEVSPSALALAGDPRWIGLLGAPRTSHVGAQQLAGTPVHRLDYVAGTAHCQRFLLIEARPGSAARSLPSPFQLQELDLCMTQSARFAQVLGLPAFVVGGAPSMTSPDLHYRIAPWTGKAWGQRCSVTLRRQTAMSVAQRFCAPGSSVCDAAEPVAQRLAQAYEAARAANQPLDATAFNDGREPDAAVAAALSPPLDEPHAVGHMNPPFPLFGADGARLDPMQTVFSNADPRVLPVRVGDRWWLAVVGRCGVGWREGDAVLVALFAPPGRAADGVASYQFRIVPTGLRDVTAADERR